VNSHLEEVRAEVAELLDKAERQPRQLVADAVLDAAVRWYLGQPGSTAILATAAKHWFELSQLLEPLSPPPKARRIRVKRSLVFVGLKPNNRWWGWKCECGLGGSFFAEPGPAADQGRTHLMRAHGTSPQTRT
jgi:hypothetical protein